MVGGDREGGGRPVGGDPVRVGVLGAGGRMGRTVCAALEAAPGLDLVARVDPHTPGYADHPNALGAAGVQVAVDFTRPDAVMDNVRWCVAHGVHLVVGTTGITADRLDQLRAWLGADPRVGVAVVPNFAIGAVLLMRFAAEAARFYDAVEIVELHHPGKVDAPSGTARRTAELVAAAQRDAGRDSAPDATDPGASLPGARGARVRDVAVHAIRLPGLVAHQEVLLGGPGETLTLRHDSTDRSSFMPGVLIAVRAVGSRPGLTLGLEPLLGL